MNRLRPLVPVFLLVLAGVFAAPACLAEPGEKADERRPFLWKVEGAVPSYLFGSIHLPDERVHELAPAVRAALRASDVVLTEIPLDTETMLAVQAGQLVSADAPLAERIPPELYARVEAYLASKGFPIALFERLKVWALSVTLGQLDYLSELAARPGLDAALWKRAGELGKTRAAVETVEEQIALFDAFSGPEQAQLLEQTLDELEAAQEGAGPTETIVEAYLAGDLDALYALLTDNVDAESVVGRKFVRLLVDERNARMAERIGERLRGAPERAHFFVVGALHYPGSGGLLERLRAQGFTLTRLEARDEVQASGDRGRAVGE